MRKQQQGFVLIELILMIFFLMQFKVTGSVLGQVMIGLSLMAMLFNMDPRDGSVLKK